MNKTSVVGYQIAVGNPDQVEEQVQVLLQNGWELNGQLMYTTFDNKNVFVQGMILAVPSENVDESGE